jgi:short-subunit dehydrogenase
LRLEKGPNGNRPRPVSVFTASARTACLPADADSSNATIASTSRRAASNGPNGVTMLACDVTDAASIEALASKVLAETSRIDLLVNNAGVGLLGAAEESSIEQVRALFDVNLPGVIRMTNAVLPSMRRRREGRIININSVLGLIPAPYNALCAATTHALEGYSESLDHETRAFNVRISLIEPA